MLSSGKTSLAQTVYDGLFADIAARRLGAGSRLIEAEIARTSDVSRTPVREALGRLERDGLIESVRPTGYVVVSPSIQDIRDIFEMRRALEPMAFAQVARHAVPEEDAAFRVLIADVAKADTPASSAKANIALRAFWVARVRNRRLRDAILRFHVQVNLVRGATLHSCDGRAAARAGTAHLSAAYLARDADAAHAAMTDFIDAALSFFERAERERTATP